MSNQENALTVWTPMDVVEIPPSVDSPHEIVQYLLHKRQRDPVYLVRFKGPDGKRKEISTKESDLGRAHHAGVRKIYLEFGCYRPPKPIKIQRFSKKTLNWDDATTLLILVMRMSGLESGTIEGYTIAIRALRAVFPDSHGPADITPKMAEQFRECRLAAGASKATASSNLMTLSSIYSKWWGKNCRLLNLDPFSGVKVVRSIETRHDEHGAIRM